MASALKAHSRGLRGLKSDTISFECCRLKQGDLNTIRLLGHRMKGDGGGYGFDQISTIGHQLEEAALAQDFERLRHHHSNLRDFLARVAVVYKR